MATVPEIPGVLGVLGVLAPSTAGTGCRTTPPPAAAGTTPPLPWMLSHKIQIPKQIIAHLWSCPQRTCWHFNWRVRWPIPTVQKPTCAICTASKSGAAGCETEGLSFHCERKTIKSSISANIWRSSSDVQDMMWQPNRGGFTMGDNRHIHLHHKLQTWQWVYTTSTRLPLPLYQHHRHGKTTMSDEGAEGGEKRSQASTFQHQGPSQHLQCSKSAVVRKRHENHVLAPFANRSKQSARVQKTTDDQIPKDGHFILPAPMICTSICWGSRGSIRSTWLAFLAAQAPKGLVLLWLSPSSWPWRTNHNATGCCDGLSANPGLGWHPQWKDSMNIEK